MLPHFCFTLYWGNRREVFFYFFFSSNALLGLLLHMGDWEQVTGSLAELLTKGGELVPYMG